MTRTYFFAALIVVISLSSCSEKFQVAAPYKDIVVVYGFLDRTDTAHYIRVQKAFLDQTKSALIMASTPDSSYYASLNVRIERFSFSDSLHWHDTIHLNRVDLNLEGYQKLPGVFFTAPNYAYKFTNPLDPHYIYRIVITNPLAGTSDSASAPVIDDSDPNVFYSGVLDTTSTTEIDFSSTDDTKFIGIDGQYSPLPDFSFEGSGNPCAIAQAIIRFNWTDSDYFSHERSPRFYDYNAGYCNIVKDQFLFHIKDVSFYSGLLAGMQDAPAHTIRLLDRMRIFIYASTQDFQAYELSSLSQGLGLTGSEIQPVYTNIKGSALGLFTSRGVRSNLVTMSQATVDSIIASPYMARANIKGTVYH